VLRIPVAAKDFDIEYFEIYVNSRAGTAVGVAQELG
jgi:hypothetical protein